MSKEAPLSVDLANPVKARQVLARAIGEEWLNVLVAAEPYANHVDNDWQDVHVRITASPLTTLVIERSWDHPGATAFHWRAVNNPDNPDAEPTHTGTIEVSDQADEVFAPPVTDHMLVAHLAQFIQVVLSIREYVVREEDKQYGAKRETEAPSAKVSG